MWMFKTIILLYLSDALCAQDSENALPVPRVHLQSPWSEVFLSEQVRLRCDLLVENWTVTWYRDEQEIQTADTTAIFSDESRSLTLKAESQTLSGNYRCKGFHKTNASHRTESNAVHITIHETPTPHLELLTPWQDVFPSETVQLGCRASSDPSDWTYEWLKDGQTKWNSDSVSSDSDGANLTISSAAASHSGEYKCRATLKSRPVITQYSSGLTLRVYDQKPQPSLIQDPEYSILFPQEPLSLLCHINISKGWEFVWYKDKTNLHVNMDKYEVSSPDGTHSGSYTCEVRRGKSHTFSSDRSQVKNVTIKNAKPNVKLLQDPDTKIFHTEDNVFFSCGVNVSSGWEYSWYRNNDNVASGPNYTIGHLHRSHSGEYKCQAKRGLGDTVFYTDLSRSVTMDVNERPSASILLLTGWSEVFSTDSLVLKCEAEDPENKDWKFKWFKGNKEIAESSTERHIITPQNDPDQSEYKCQGIRSGRPSKTKVSEPLTTKNLLLKRRVLLSISGCLVFGIFAVFLGCIILRVCRKPVVDQEKPEEADLFLTMAELAKHAPNPLAEYVSDEDIKDIGKEPTEPVENGTICSESTPLPIAPNEDEATSQSNNASGNGEMISFKQ